MELSSSLFVLPKAHETKAFALNNVPVFAKRISFFRHKPYENFFLATLQDVLSSVVTRVKRLHLKNSSNIWRQ
jgi:hypothetical protein